jgi:hypothetical protein
MTKTTIHQVIGIDGTTLIVFYTEAHCWQFRLISLGGAVFGERKIYYSAEAGWFRAVSTTKVAPS